MVSVLIRKAFHSLATLVPLLLSLGCVTTSPKNLFTSEVYHMVVTTSVEQSGWMTGGGWTK